jgi:hypothetical protein
MVVNDLLWQLPSSPINCNKIDDKEEGQSWTSLLHGEQNILDIFAIRNGNDDRVFFVLLHSHPRT